MDEEIEVMVTSYANHSGTLDMSISGSAFGTTCKDIEFTKSAGNLTLDTSACDLKGAEVKAKYCANQDSVLLAIGASARDQTGPFAHCRPVAIAATIACS